MKAVAVDAKANKSTIKKLAKELSNDSDLGAKCRQLIKKDGDCSQELKDMAKENSNDSDLGAALVEKCVIKMKNLKEIKLMMERLESPRLTETELNYKKSLLKEENEETTQDPDQLDLFTGETKEVNELVAQFEELKKIDIR